MVTTLGAFLSPAEFSGPGGLWSVGREGSVAAETVRGERQRRRERREQRSLPYARAGRVAINEPVLLVPGFMAGDWSLGRLGEHLRSQGLRTYRSSIAVNAGCTMRTSRMLEERLEEIAQRRGTKVTIVGHSLGGMLARGLGARRPDLVAGIVTLASPLLAPGAVNQLLGWNATILSGLHRVGVRRVMSSDCVAGACARESWEQLRAPIDAGIGFTSVYSQHDGVVDWRSCLDPAATHVEVGASHLGMVVDPAVRAIVVETLAEQRLTRAAAAGDREERPDERFSPASPPAAQHAPAGPLRVASR